MVLATASSGGMLRSASTSPIVRARRQRKHAAKRAALQAQAGSWLNWGREHFLPDGFARKVFKYATHGVVALEDAEIANLLQRHTPKTRRRF